MTRVNTAFARRNSSCGTTANLSCNAEVYISAVKHPLMPFKQLWLWLLLIAICCACSAQAAGDTFSVFFRSGESILTEGIRHQIDDAIYLGTLSDRDATVLIGYADEVGSGDSNMRLSKARAAAVKAYLIQSGFREERIALLIGKGKKEARTATGGEGYPRDRRVDIVRTVAPQVQVQTQVPLAKRIDTVRSIPIDISKVAAGESIRVDNIYFQAGRHYFQPQSEASLDALYKTLREHPKVRIRIEGHVCCTPGENDGLDEDTNIYDLSETRAQAVRSYLIKKGIAPVRLEAVGMARHKPIYPVEQNETEAQANRRVEIRVLQ